MDPSRYAEIFLEESREHLTQINQQLLAWERDPTSPEPVTPMFRAVHNIKGMAATMGYLGVATISHRVETLLDRYRRHPAPVSPEVLDLLFRAADALEEGVEAAVGGAKPGFDPSELVAQLDAVAVELAPADEPESADRVSLPAITSPTLGGRTVRVVIRPDAALKGARALIVLSRVQALGPVFGIQPAPAAIESDTFDGHFEFQVDTDRSDEQLEEEIRRAGDVSEVVMLRASEAPEAPANEAPTGRTRHLRVDLRRLDTLMNLIGEMVTVRGELVELSARRADPELEDVAVQVSHLTHDLQTEIIEARMTPGWQIFDRFPRLVRDVARQLGKRVSLRVEGKEIELDRALLDELGDPLVHLLRNAVDHGIETPEEREAAGKPAEATIVLSAARERSTVVIRVADDGRGLDAGRILAQARAKGLVEGEVGSLSDDDLLRLIAAPGFSTASGVSDVSGRGVGIDVVVTRMRRLGGSVEMATRPGRGTTFTLRLPPTLAIVPALVADVAEEQYALPLTHVEETLDLDQVAVTEVEGAESIVLRDEVVPLRRLRHLVDVEGQGPRSQPVIVVAVGERRSGVVVDRVSSQREIVVKSFRAPVGTAPIFGGATILGDGRPIFILDAARLL